MDSMCTVYTHVILDKNIVTVLIEGEVLTLVRVVTFPGGEALDILLSPSTSK